MFSLIVHSVVAIIIIINTMLMPLPCGVTVGICIFMRIKRTNCEKTKTKGKC